MKRRLWIPFVFSLALIYPALCFALMSSGSLNFSPASLEVSAYDGYHRVNIQGCDLSREIGFPQLPVKTVLIAVPVSAEIEEIEAVSLESEEIPGEYTVLPAQPPQVLPMMGLPRQPVEFVEPDASVYASPEAYPAEIIGATRTGFLLGYKVVGITVHPVQYTPSEGKLVLHTRMDVRVKYRTGSAALRVPIDRSEALNRLCREFIGSLTLNGEQALFQGPSSEPVSTTLPPDDYEYVIVTSAEFDSVFQRLADWKTKKGVPAWVATTEWIDATYSGWDGAERIRNFIKDAYANWGTMWVLLGGDVNIVPDRIAFAMECQAGFYPDEDSIRADHYFSDLDGTWDLNGNHIYGEVADNVDLYTDVYVARAAGEDLSELQTFVNKVIAYERNPTADYQRDIGFFAEVLWSTPYTDAAVFKDMIDDESVPSFFNITKLYERDGNETKANVIAAINAGQSVINHAGHCAYSVMSVGQGSLFREDMDTLANGSRTGFMYSIGCWPAAFDYDCVAEHFLNNPNGGGVGFIGNSRYGWGSPGNPGYGFSDMFDIEFFNQLFNEKSTKVGATLAATKAVYAPRSSVENVYRWHQYQLNVLGDPEMSIWTDSLGVLDVHCPDSISVGTSEFLVTVEDGASPVPNALVCLMKDTEVYERALTDASGQILFTISPSTPGVLQVTATAQDYIPYEDSSDVFAAGPFVKYYRGYMADTTGNGDGVCNPGEKIWLGSVIKNYGSQTATSVDGVISTGDIYLALDETLSTFGDLVAGDTSLGSPDFEFNISSACTNGHVAYLDLYTVDGSGHSWRDVIAVRICAPVLTCPGYSVRDTTGNNNGIPEPGETVAVLAYIKNSGLGDGRGVEAHLACNDPYISVSGSLATVGDIEAGKEGWARFVLQIDGACPAPHFPWLEVTLSTSESQTYSDSLMFVIGMLGFADDVESGVGDWSYEGLWHITEHRSHSPSHSWYCGNEGTWQYNTYMNASLTGPWFVVGPKAYLSFWHWYDMPIYGSDGLYIEIDDGSGWTTLDFKGCGGALDSLLPGRVWFNEWYDLSAYSVGDSARVRFRFLSDSDDVGEGWYLDDINVGAECTGVEENRAVRMRTGGPRLYQNRPNPFNSVTTVYAFSPRESRVTVEIYDLAGRSVASLPMISSGSGMLAATWDGTSSEGAESPAGTYFYRLNPSLGTKSRKMILLR